MTQKQQSMLRAETNDGVALEPEVALRLADLRREPKAKIIIHERHDENEPQDVYVGVNGVVFIIKRGHEVEVPLPVALVLEQSRQTRYEFVKDEEGRMREMRPREAPSYPFSWIGGRPDDMKRSPHAGGYS